MERRTFFDAILAAVAAFFGLARQRPRQPLPPLDPLVEIQSGNSGGFLVPPEFVQTVELQGAPYADGPWRTLERGVFWRHVPIEFEISAHEGPYYRAMAHVPGGLVEVEMGRCRVVPHAAELRETAYQRVPGRIPGSVVAS